MCLYLEPRMSFVWPLCVLGDNCGWKTYWPCKTKRSNLVRLLTLLLFNYVKCALFHTHTQSMNLFLKFYFLFFNVDIVSFTIFMYVSKRRRHVSLVMAIYVCTVNCFLKEWYIFFTLPFSVTRGWNARMLHDMFRYKWF